MQADPLICFSFPCNKIRFLHKEAHMVIFFKHNDINNVPKSCKVHLYNIRPVCFLYVFTCMKISLFVQIETFSHLRLYLFHYVIKHIDN